MTIIMGPSGTGKSVFLSHMIGLLMPDGGSLLVDGRPVADRNQKELNEMRKRMGMLFQDGALFSSINLYDNVALPLRKHTDLSETKIREIVMARLKEVGLAGAESRMPNQISGGMRKRAGLARALRDGPRAAPLRRAATSASTRSGPGSSATSSSDTWKRRRT